MGQKTTTIKDNSREELAAKKGEVGDSAMEAIGKGVNAIQQGKGGQDHSTEDHELQMPREGVGAIQDRNLIKEDIADIEGAEKLDDTVHLNDGE